MGCGLLTLLHIHAIWGKSCDTSHQILVIVADPPQKMGGIWGGWDISPPWFFNMGGTYPPHLAEGWGGQIPLISTKLAWGDGKFWGESAAGEKNGGKWSIMGGDKVDFWRGSDGLGGGSIPPII